MATIARYPAERPNHRRRRITVGVLAGWQLYEGASVHPYLESIYSGIRATAREQGCNLLLACGLGPETGPDTFSPAWPTLSGDADFVPVGPWNTDGLIVVPPLLSQERSQQIQAMKAAGHPIVFVGLGEDGPSIDADNEGGIRQAISHLVWHGHRSIAFLAGYEDKDERGDTGDRLRAYRALVKELGLEADERLIAYGLHNPSGGRGAMRRMLASGVRFTAVQTSNDGSAIGAIEALQEAGLRVPQDVAVVGFDDRLIAVAQVPALTSVYFPESEAGHRALELLLEHIEGRRSGPERVRVSTRLVIRQSCGCSASPAPTALSHWMGKGSHPPDDAADLQVRLADAMAAAVQENSLSQPLAAEAVRELCHRLVSVFCESIQRNSTDHFHTALMEFLQRIDVADDDAHRWQVAVSVLRAGLPSVLQALGQAPRRELADDMLHLARTVISDSARRRDSRHRVQENSQATRVGEFTTRLLAALDEEQILTSLSNDLKDIGVQNAHAMFYEPEKDDPVAWCNLRLQNGSQGLTRRFPTRQFPPPGVYPDDRPISLALLPLKFGDTTAGFLAFDSSHLEPCATIVYQLVAALKSARLFRETRRRTDELTALVQVSLALRTAGTRTEMLPVMLDQVLALLNADGAALALRQPDTGDTMVELARGVWSAWTGESVPANDGAAHQAIATGRPFVQPDAVPLALAAVPLIAQNHVLGALWVGRKSPVGDSELRLLNAVGDMAANAIRRVTLHEQTEQRLQRLAALQVVEMAINASLDVRVTLNVLLDQVTTQLRVDAADILLFNVHTQSLEFAAGRGFHGAFTRPAVHLGEGYAGRAALERRPISVPDLSRSDNGLYQSTPPTTEGFVSYYAAPLIAKGQVKGVLEIFHRAPLHTNPEWLAFLEALMGQAALAIDNTVMFDQLQRSNAQLALAYDVTLEGWSRALDLRDKETEGHTRRVTEISMRLARAMGLSEEELVHVRRGALLHDIGKMGIPDQILLKPGPLTDEEWVVMRQHPVHAYQLLSPIAHLRPALDIPYCHHEKWDGSGYPRGLQREQIPLAARIFTLVDVWDALLSDRPYRRAWPAEQVHEYLRGLAGQHFDPQVVPVFMRLLPELSALRARREPARSPSA